MSSKNSFEYIKNSINEAYDNSQPPYDEHAWNKMEALLNKEEKKRKISLWRWLMLLLLLAGTWGVYKLSQPSSLSEKSGNVAKQTTVQQEINSVNNQQIILSDDIADVSASVKNAVFSGNKIHNPAGSNSKKNISFPSSFSKIVHNSLNTSIENVSYDNNVIASSQENKLYGVIEKVIVERSKPYEKEAVVPAIQNIQNDSLKNTTRKQTQKIKDNKIAIDKKYPPKNKGKNIKGFYLLASVGADKASVKLFSYANSTVTAKYGISMGYQLNNNWSVQSGFYTSRKKYTAGPEDYHPREGSYWNMVQIKKVKAACLVYEIPIAVRYNFIQRLSSVYYATMGLASYILKKEDYNYEYTRNNVLYQKYWEYTGNKHLFSNLSLSVGIEKRLTSAFSLLAEPSFSIPISGVGDGRVNLFSTNLQIAIKYNLIKKH